jgi:hypothetical protein
MMRSSLKVIIPAIPLILSGCKGTTESENSINRIISSISLPGNRDSELHLSTEWTFKKNSHGRSEFLYVFGGTDSMDKASSDRGSADSKKIRMIGDYAGELRLFYENGKTDTIPLVYGYTLWYRNSRNLGKDPFIAENKSSDLLDSTLYLNNFYDSKKEYILRIRLRHSAITRAAYFDNRLKDGTVKFMDLQFSGPGIKMKEDTASFYTRHTIDTLNTYPPVIRQNLKRMIYSLYSLNSDFQSVTHADIPAGYHGPSMVFTGGPEANIITSVFHHNLKDQVSRVGRDSLVHESAFRYTQNKTIMILPDLNYIEEANRALDLLDKQMMYLGRLTRQTEKGIGSHYHDYGNPETDGPGPTMMSHWKTWQNSGRNKQWAVDRWTRLKEAADFLLWSLDHPDLSFSKYGLICSESRAGMNDYTLYCNFPCYLGLLMYAEMADEVGAKEDAMKWRSAAVRMKAGMNRYFAEEDSRYGKTWKKTGFLYENILMTLKEYAGFDLADKLPAEWLERCRNTYEKNKAGRPDYYAPSGLVYDHDILLQTAMLLDKMDDVTKWMTNLAHLCYSPRLSGPFTVPECASVDVKRGIITRQGDAGNEYQQAETVNSIILCGGIDDNTPGTLNIMPRLPDQWKMNIADYPAMVYLNGLSYTAYIDMNVNWQIRGQQTIFLKVISGGDLMNVHFRMGPFPPGTRSIIIGINRKKKVYPCFDSGDRSWAWVVIPEIGVGSNITLKTHN